MQVIQLQGDQRKNVSTFLVQVLRPSLLLYNFFLFLIKALMYNVLSVM